MRGARHRAALGPPFAYLPSAASPAAVDPNRVGIVFVHGIGSFAPGDTVRQFSTPLVELVGAWCTEHGYTGDVVVREEYDPTGLTLPFLELAIPAHDGHPAQRWVLTEAWWSSIPRTPSVRTMTAYVRRALPKILDGIRKSYSRRIEERQARRAEAEGASGESAALLAGTVRRRWAWIDVLDHLQRDFTLLALPPLLFAATVVLSVYAPFRSLRLGPIRDLAVLRSADNLLTRWFGAVPALLDHPVEASRIEFRLVNAIRGLRAEGCGRIVVVAHSGGAVVSFTTLNDEAYLNEPVDKLVTLGQALGMAWRIQDAWKGEPEDRKLAGDLTQKRPSLIWPDFWSSYDPAPSGPLNPPPCARVRDDSIPTVNQMSILQDHGTYWDNDEEFQMPLLRHLDTPNGRPDESRFYRDMQYREVRVERRRQRVATLALWRWIATGAPVVPLAMTTVLAVFGIRPGLERLLERTVGGQLVDAGTAMAGTPLDALLRAVTWPHWPLALAQWILAVVVVVAVSSWLKGLGERCWARWDLRERHAARQMVLAPVRRREPAATYLGLTLVAVLLCIVVFVAAWA